MHVQGISCLVPLSIKCITELVDLDESLARMPQGGAQMVIPKATAAKPAGVTAGYIGDWWNDLGGGGAPSMEEWKTFKLDTYWLYLKQVSTTSDISVSC